MLFNKDEWATIIIDNKASDYQVSKRGEVRKIGENVICNPTYDSIRDRYYISIVIFDTLYTKPLDEIVLNAFSCQDHGDYPHIRHLDGSSLNNDFDNLAWCRFTPRKIK